MTSHSIRAAVLLPSTPHPSPLPEERELEVTKTPPCEPKRGDTDRSLAPSFDRAQQKHASRNRPSKTVNTNFSSPQALRGDPVTHLAHPSRLGYFSLLSSHGPSRRDYITLLAIEPKDGTLTCEVQREEGLGDDARHQDRDSGRAGPARPHLSSQTLGLEDGADRPGNVDLREVDLGRRGIRGRNGDVVRLITGGRHLHELPRKVP